MMEAYEAFWKSNIPAVEGCWGNGRFAEIDGTAKRKEWLLGWVCRRANLILFSD